MEINQYTNLENAENGLKQTTEKIGFHVCTPEETENYFEDRVHGITAHHFAYFMKFAICLDDPS